MTQRAVCWTGVLAVILRGMEGVPSRSNVRLGWILSFFSVAAVIVVAGVIVLIDPGQAQTSTPIASAASPSFNP